MQEYTIVFQEGLAKGLRSTPRAAKNAQSLLISEGAVPEDNILRTLDAVTAFGASLECAWPYPQIFQLKELVLVCTADALYDYVGGAFVPIMTGLTVGTAWSVADYWNYIIASNGSTTVTRDGATREWSEVTWTGMPTWRCVADINGQVFIGGLTGSLV